MKKTLSSMLVLAILITSASAFNSNTTDQIEGTATIKSVNGYTFELTEMSTQTSGTVLLFEREHNSSVLSQLNANYDETEALLLALGMEQQVIDRLSPETMDYYARTPRITSSITYTKYDSEGNMSYVSEVEAIQAVEQSKLAPIYDETKVNGYLRLHYLVTDLGHGDFHFSTSARWLTMPYWRQCDSIGACAQIIAVDDDTRSGYYGYDYREVDSGVVTVDSVERSIISDEMANPINGNWYGSGARVYLPTDGTRGNYSITNTNFYAHYEFEGSLNHPSLVTNFNTIGSYDHAQATISISPSLGIDLGTGDVSASLGLAILGKKDRTCIEFLVKYIP